jgi:hypothetical protein
MLTRSTANQNDQHLKANQNHCSTLHNHSKFNQSESTHWSTTTNHALYDDAILQSNLFADNQAQMIDKKSVFLK